MGISSNNQYWDGEELFFCKTCGNELPKNFMHDSTHNIVPLDWIRFCGNCDEVIEKEWSYCAYCGQSFSDW